MVDWSSLVETCFLKCVDTFSEINENRPHLLSPSLKRLLATAFEPSRMSD
jgi:hypothetical protein